MCCLLRIMFMGQTLWSEISNSDISLFNFAIISLFLASYINAFIIVPVQCILLFRRNGVIRIRELYVNSLGKILVVLMQDRNHLCDDKTRLYLITIIMPDKNNPVDTTYARVPFDYDLCHNYICISYLT